MSKTTTVFQTVPVKVQDRSGFDMSHENLFTATVGTLIPASVEEVMPGDIVSVGAACSVELPPLVTNFKGRVDARLEAFFVPNRLLWAGWKDFITQDPNHSSVSGLSGNPPASVPLVQLTAEELSVGSLSDYLGIRGLPTSSGASIIGEYNALPYLAYWKIWEDWYRDSNIQKPFFQDGFNSTNNVYNASLMPYTRLTGSLSSISSVTDSNSKLGVNGKNMCRLAQRNFAKDYFTTMTAKPQAGADSILQFDVTTEAGTSPGVYEGEGSFSIRSLRAANALQKWLERNNIAGTRYYDQILAHYGVLPSDAVFQRPVLLGAMTQPVIVNSVATQMQPSFAITGSTTGYTSQNGSYYVSSRNAQKNPYLQSAGAMTGHGSAFGKDRLIDNFEVKEHGYIIIMFSLVPHAYYSTGCRRYINPKTRKVSGDYAFPEFAGIGDQEVYLSELNSQSASGSSVVGYAQRYAEYKYHEDEVHGLLRDGESLASFVLQRGFDTGVTLGSELLEIPKVYLDDVMVTTVGVSGFNAIVDAYFDAKYLRVLPQYSLPSLCESEGEGKKINVPKNGIRL